jgi:hypothetical protein
MAVKLCTKDEAPSAAGPAGSNTERLLVLASITVPGCLLSDTLEISICLK